MSCVLRPNIQATNQDAFSACMIPRWQTPVFMLGKWMKQKQWGIFCCWSVPAILRLGKYGYPSLVSVSLIFQTRKQGSAILESCEWKMCFYWSIEYLVSAHNSGRPHTVTSTPGEAENLTEIRRTQRAICWANVLGWLLAQQTALVFAAEFRDNISHNFCNFSFCSDFLIKSLIFISMSETMKM